MEAFSRIADQDYQQTQQENEERLQKGDKAVNEGNWTRDGGQ